MIKFCVHSSTIQRIRENSKPLRRHVGERFSLYQLKCSHFEKEEQKWWNVLWWKLLLKYVPFLLKGFYFNPEKLREKRALLNSFGHKAHNAYRFFFHRRKCHFTTNPLLIKVLFSFSCFDHWIHLALGVIHKRRRPIFPNLWPPSLPLSPQITK